MPENLEKLKSLYGTPYFRPKQLPFVDRYERLVPVMFHTLTGG